MIQTEENPDYSDDSCTCEHDQLAFGDGFGHKRPFFNHNKVFSKVESNKNYGTATEHELNAPYLKQIADRYEAEYDYCMRWACDYKYVAAKVIPFQSNFYSVAKLIFKEKNWALDCANFEGGYDFCGWLPSVSASIRMKKSLLTDSSEFTHPRIEAGRTLRSSDTGYGLKSLQTDYSDDKFLYSEGSGLTKSPIDYDVYQIMGSASDIEESPTKNSFHSTLENLSPILKHDMVVASSSEISTQSQSSLKAVFHDLVELNHIFAQQVEEAEAQRSSFDDYVNCLTTARSFSNISLSTHHDLVTGESWSAPTSTEATVVAPKNSTMFSHLICLSGKKFNIAFWKNWSKSKN